ncbi:cytochrome d ubiquinol oxidase subunit II [Gluconobacter wancherniae]|uniref:Ubiquinol oxidase subunit II, cyanide insensitive n=1 Tax=Gluconobacter wancherniae NBRC 103581 TaxID=656744 RepID=A0A511B1I9_9PROT|nr:cytochrome d ubiquinol oxidase subunit II [Gluconobacter wancherniae]MBF0853863.1 cytochrome d ubiquinol oxidase subunit II [Gluconobacter wancherniae]MBS1062249.1 cytochrome d ubiquinol oxidase subunit II [Gluconobacter wancherniae]MBS1089123.1 cytochrome d ubiquinol oxidase subunit II [Gluconobacter wancherniae]MBS1094291.1 cytochrome d ubiquinol oxidase subunit II [Gluconobacter wancherniae]MBS1094620.1 cytochrome d ubiquinol oxidase subunit II [Gluconobacter wancherniae]
MTDTAFWLPVVWAFLAATAIFIYVVLDGFDLGIGILFLKERDHDHRNVMVNTVAPVWDGNETWMIFGGASLYGVFPVAYGTILPALYLPILFMLLALILRGVSFEFRFKMKKESSQFFWDSAFCGGSIVASFMQGIILGTLVQGIKVENNVFVGSSLDWCTPFALFCGLAVSVGYALLGSTWLMWRCETDLHDTMRKVSFGLAGLLLVMIGAVSIWTPMLHATYMQRWLDWPQVALVAPVPVAVIAATAFLFLGLRNPKSHILPFICTLVLFFLCFSGLGINVWPYIVPPSITIWQASSPPDSQAFLLVGTMFLLPTILAYTIYSYYVFRGKVTADQHYH